MATQAAPPLHAALRAFGARRSPFAAALAPAPARRTRALARFAAPRAVRRSNGAASDGSDSDGGPAPRRAKAAPAKPLPSLAPPPPPPGAAVPAAKAPRKQSGGAAAREVSPAPAPAPPLGGYQSGSEGSETDGEYATDVETDDEGEVEYDEADLSELAQRARAKLLATQSAEPFFSATGVRRSAKTTPGPREAAPVMPATSSQEGCYRCRFVTAVDLPEGDVPVVMGTLDAFGPEGAVQMRRTLPLHAVPARWEALVDLPLNQKVAFRLGVMHSSGPPNEEPGPPRVVRARSRTAEVAARCKWGHGEEPVRVQVAYASVTFNVPTASPKFGASLAVLGSCAALGAWSPAAAVPLSWAGGGGVGSAWRSAVIALPVQENMIWCLCERGADGLLRPEPGPQRTLSLRRFGGGVVTATWGEFGKPGAPPGEPLQDRKPRKRASAAGMAPAIGQDPKEKSSLPTLQAAPAAAALAAHKASVAQSTVDAATLTTIQQPIVKPGQPPKTVKPEEPQKAAPPATEAVRARRTRDDAGSLEAALLDPLVPMLTKALPPSIAQRMSWTRDAAVAGALAPPTADDATAKRGLLRVDLAVMLPHMALLFECDEDAHRATRSRYAPEREAARMEALAMALAAETPPRSAAFVRIAVPRVLAGDGAVWAESTPLAALRSRAVLAAVSLAEAPVVRGVYRVAYVQLEGEVDDVVEVTLPGMEAQAPAPAAAPKKKAAAPAAAAAPNKEPPQEPSVEPQPQPKLPKKAAAAAAAAAAPNKEPLQESGVEPPQPKLPKKDKAAAAAAAPKKVPPQEPGVEPPPPPKQKRVKKL